MHQRHFIFLLSIGLLFVLAHCGNNDSVDPTALTLPEPPVTSAPPTVSPPSSSTPSTPTPTPAAPTVSLPPILAHTDQHSLRKSEFGTENSTAASANFQLTSTQFMGANGATSNHSTNYTVTSELPSSLIVRGIP